VNIRAVPWFTVSLAFLIGALGTLFMMFYWFEMAQSGWSPPVLETAGIIFGVALIIALGFPQTRALIFGLIAGSVGSVAGLIGLLTFSSYSSRLNHELNTVKYDDLSPAVLEQSIGLELPPQSTNLHSILRRNERATIYVRFEMPQSVEAAFFASNKLKVFPDETHFWVHEHPNRDWWNAKRSDQARYVFLVDYAGTWGVPTTKTGFDPSLQILEHPNGTETVYLVASKF
jgi:hypothetical protein